MRARASLFFAATSVLALLAWACGSFGDAEEPPGDDGGIASDALSDVTIDDDGGGPDAGDDAPPALATVAPPCPRPPGPSCVPDLCERRTLYTPATAGAEYPFAIATDAAFVYWVTMSNDAPGDSAYDGRGTSRIMRVDRKGALAGGKATVVAEKQRMARTLTMAGEFVYWAALDGQTAPLRRVRRDCASDCQVEDVLSLQGASAISNLVAIDDRTLVAVAEVGTVFVVKLSAGGPTVSNTGTTSAFPSLAAGSAEAFVTGGQTRLVQRISSSSSTLTPFGTVPDAGDSGLNAGMSPIVSDCQDVYGWRAAGNLWKIADSGGTATAAASIIDVDRVFDLAADQELVYLGAPDGTGIIAVPRAGGAPQPVVSGANVHRIAVDDVGLYYGDHANVTGGALWMIVK